MIFVAALAINRACRVQFDRIAQLRGAAMSFVIVNIARIDSSRRDRILHHSLLGRTVRHRQPGTRTVLVDRGT